MKSRILKTVGLIAAMVSCWNDGICSTKPGQLLQLLQL